MILRIIGRDFTAAVILNEKNMVWEAPSILRYMRGWTRDRVLSYCSEKRWRCESV